MISDDLKGQIKEHSCNMCRRPISQSPYFLALGPRLKFEFVASYGIPVRATGILFWLPQIESARVSETLEKLPSVLALALPLARF